MKWLKSAFLPRSTPQVLVFICVMHVSWRGCGWVEKVLKPLQLLQVVIRWVCIWECITKAPPPGAMWHHGSRGCRWVKNASALSNSFKWWFVGVLLLFIECIPKEPPPARCVITGLMMVLTWSEETAARMVDEPSRSILTGVKEKKRKERG